jgi:hypothetical protein
MQNYIITLTNLKYNNHNPKIINYKNKKNYMSLNLRER